jgi:hypothetical protein
VSSVRSLVDDVAAARSRYLETLGNPTLEQATFKPALDEWSFVDITEHLTLAEQVGINAMWKALDACHRGTPVWSGDPVHRGKTIEQVIEATWKEREQVPAIAAPRWGGPIQYWVAALRSCQSLLEELGTALQDVDLAQILYPHPISGPLDARQRLEFLAFHLDRHRDQILRVRSHVAFPGIRSYTE